MKIFGFGNKRAEEQRNLTANDHEYNSTFEYANNEIKTSYYTWYNFIFINLFEQFHRIVNIYFVFLLVLTFIPEITSLNPVTTLLPILFVLAVTAIKDGADDYYRHKSDRAVNSRKTSVLQNGKLKEYSWKNIEVGQIIKLHNNEQVPADMLLLSSSIAQSIVFIETAELDGETNLKVRQALPSTEDMGKDLKSLKKFKGQVKCEAPNNHLHKFTGNLYWKDETFPIDNEKILLRGCTLRNTEWCFGLVIFAGPDTKLMKNAGVRNMKRTSIERFMNQLVMMIFLILIVLCSITAIMNSVWEADIGDLFQIFLPWDESAPNPQMSGFLMFWSNLILLNTLIPISLYVTVELIRLGQSFFINWDRQMYYAKKNLPAEARTTTLNEELGQVEYIFSDKTGTLTQNVMKFNKCSIAGKRYGDICNQDGKIILEIENDGLVPVDLSYNKYAEPSFKFYDQRLVKKIQSGDEICSAFFRLITVCHSAMVEETETGLVYHTQSPDEAALVSAAKNFGFVFKGRNFDNMLVEEMGKQIEYKVLAMLDFNNERKRMSVIVEDETGQITLYCKGADSVVYDRLSSDSNQKLKERTAKHLTSFSQTGLRTLCLAMKQIDKEDFDVWNASYQKASTALEDRDEKLSAVYEEIERDMILLGATAIEDKLQDGVPQTIANLSKANIKIWVLTGDKQETAINIGYSCNMLAEDKKNVFVIKGYDPDEIETEIQKALNAVTSSYSQVHINKSFQPDNDKCAKRPRKNFLSLCSKSSNSSESLDFDKTAKGNLTYGLVINGHSLVYALGDDLKEKFLELATSCSAVICCRVTPLQKAKVVELVKKNKKAVTLAIGDGANDVSMIKAAHIGVGISGEEGTQAVLSSDFAFGQFRYLERLLLVHGRWSYMRICKFLSYFFFKNFAFTLVHFWYGIYCGFSAQSAYDDWFITMYNTVYTATPILVLAIIDQDVDEDRCVRLPKLYLPGQRSEYFNYKSFVFEFFQGVIASLILFFFTYGTLHKNVNFNGMDSTDLQTMTYVISTSLMMIVTAQVALDTSFWTGLNHLFTWGSLAIYFPFSFALCSYGLHNFSAAQFPFIGAPENALSFPTTWLTVILITVTYTVSAVALRFLRSLVRPSHVEKVLKLDAMENHKPSNKVSPDPEEAS